VLRADYQELAALDEPGRRDGRPHRGGQTPDAVRHRGAEAAYLPRLATGELRATMRSPSGGGSDLQNMSTTVYLWRPRRPRRAPDGLLINGSKTWISNARRSGLIALLCKTTPTPHTAQRLSIALVVMAGLTVSRDCPSWLQGRRDMRVDVRRLLGPVSSVLGGIMAKAFRK